MARQASHVHKFRRHTYRNGTKVFFCALPDCLFKIGIEFALGKRCICWRCGKEFILTAYALRLAQPHCPDCHGRKTDRVVDNQEITAKKDPISQVLDLQSRMNDLTNLTLDNLEVVKDEEL